MKRTASVAFVLAASAVMAQGQNPPRRTLYDFIRSAPSYKEPALSSQETQRVLRAVLGKRYKGRGGNASITEKVSGAFLAPNSKDTAYVVRGSNPNPSSTIGMQNDSRLIVFSGNRLALNVSFEGMGILRTGDLNGDGVQELLLYGGWTWQGEEGTTAQLVEVKASRLRVVKDFGQVEKSRGCDSDESSKNGVNIAAIITYTPTGAGKFPAFRTDFYKGACPDKQGKENPASFRFVQRDKIPE